MTPEDLTDRLNKLEISNAEIKTELRNQHQDLREIKVELNGKVSGLTRVAWGVFVLLFSGFITALGILLSQGGIH